LLETEFQLLICQESCVKVADRVEMLFPTALAIAIGNELPSEVPEAAIRFVKTWSMR